MNFVAHWPREDCWDQSEVTNLTSNPIFHLHWTESHVKLIIHDDPSFKPALQPTNNCDSVVISTIIRSKRRNLLSSKCWLSLQKVLLEQINLNKQAFRIQFAPPTNLSNNIFGEKRRCYVCFLCSTSNVIIYFLNCKITASWFGKLNCF